VENDKVICLENWRGWLSLQPLRSCAEWWHRTPIFFFLLLVISQHFLWLDYLLSNHRMVVAWWILIEVLSLHVPGDIDKDRRESVMMRQLHLTSKWSCPKYETSVAAAPTHLALSSYSMLSQDLFHINFCSCAHRSLLYPSTLCDKS
jgi:hypothetical protein